MGPGCVDTDLGIQEIPGYRSSALEFRAEAFNVFNNVNMSNPNAVLSSPKYGVIAGASAVRIYQFALRLLFEV